MKQALKLKGFLATAAFLVSSAASAVSGYAWNAGTGTGNLVFSPDALSALKTSGSSVLTTSTIPSLTNLTGLTVGAINAASYTKANGTVSLTFNDATGVGDTLTTLQAANSLVNIRRTLVEDGVVLGTLNVYMANFNVNLTNSTIFADLYTSTDAGALVSFGKRAIFTADVPGVVGGTGGNIVLDSVSANGVANGHASGSLAGNLRINTAAADIILTALDLGTTGPVADLVRNANWGATSASGVFTAPALVPEPSTYALMGLGLCGIGLLNRRRHQA